MSLERAIPIAVCAYLLMMVVTFGPATIESERAMEAYKKECAAEGKPCVWGPSRSDALFKAMFWPFWLSYKAAEAMMAEEAGR